MARQATDQHDHHRGQRRPQPRARSSSARGSRRLHAGAAAAVGARGRRRPDAARLWHSFVRVSLASPLRAKRTAISPHLEVILLKSCRNRCVRTGCQRASPMGCGETGRQHSAKRVVFRSMTWLELYSIAVRHPRAKVACCRMSLRPPSWTAAAGVAGRVRCCRARRNDSLRRVCEVL